LGFGVYIYMYNKKMNSKYILCLGFGVWGLGLSY